MDHYIDKVADITFTSNDFSRGAAVPAPMSQERYFKRLQSIVYQTPGTNTYVLGQYFAGLFAQCRADGGQIRSDGEHHPALVKAALSPQGLFDGVEITQVGEFQRVVVEAGTEPAKS